jgi:hypothetical protein
LFEAVLGRAFRTTTRSTREKRFDLGAIASENRPERIQRHSIRGNMTGPE